MRMKFIIISHMILLNEQLLFLMSNSNIVVSGLTFTTIHLLGQGD